MAIHVPFSKRPSGRQQAQPVYIGFEPPRRKRPKFNWWGFNGLFLFFGSLGILSPIALLVSLMGLRRRPRKMAVAGTALSLIGTAVMAAGIISVATHAQQMERQRVSARYQHQIAGQVEEAKTILAFAADEFEDYRDENDGQLPCDLDGCALAIKTIDPWEKEIMYNVDQDMATLRSAGPDGDFFTGDDVTYDIEGDTQQQTLLPVDEALDGENDTITESDNESDSGSKEAPILSTDSD